MNKKVVIFESDTHRVKVRHLQNIQYSVCLYRGEDWMVASGVNAESFDDAFQSWREGLIRNHPHFTEILETIE